MSKNLTYKKILLQNHKNSVDDTRFHEIWHRIAEDTECPHPRTLARHANRVMKGEYYDAILQWINCTDNKEEFDKCWYAGTHAHIMCIVYDIDSDSDPLDPKDIRKIATAVLSRTPVSLEQCVEYRNIKTLADCLFAPRSSANGGVVA